VTGTGKRRLTAAAAANVLPIALIGGAAFFVRPISLGGETGVTVVSGQSMEPTFHTSDLIITRPKATYEVGDVVVFKVPDGVAKGRDIVHRIESRLDDGSFLAQGDNNKTTDPWPITNADIVGAKWVMIPKGALLGNIIRSVPALAVVIGGTVAWAMWPRRDEEDEEAGVKQSGVNESEVSPELTEDERFERWLLEDDIDDDLHIGLEVTEVETETLKTEVLKTETLKTETLKTETLKTETLKTETLTTETLTTDEVDNEFDERFERWLLDEEELARDEEFAAWDAAIQPALARAA
jgi:signal peptidase I